MGHGFRVIGSIVRTVAGARAGTGAGAALLLMLAAGAARAAKPPSTGPADPDDIQAPRRMVAAAQDQVDAAQHELENVSKTLRPAFEASEPWTGAQTSLRDARTAKTAASEPVLAALRQRDDYKAAATAKTDAAAALEKLRAAGAPQGDIVAASKKNAEASAAVARMEAAALDADPAAVAASKKLGDAQAQVAKLETQFKASVTDSPQYKKAKQKLEAARIKRDKAQVVLDNRTREKREKQEAKHQRQMQKKH